MPASFPTAPASSPSELQRKRAVEADFPDRKVSVESLTGGGMLRKESAARLCAVESAVEDANIQSTPTQSSSLKLPKPEPRTTGEPTPTLTMATGSVLIINGPNLNLLGTREPHIYGAETLSDVEQSAKSQGEGLGIKVSTFQSNHEGYIIDRIHEARGNVDFIIINPGALTHTSVGLRDALTGVSIPFIECHISNVHAREEFRHKSFLSDKAVAVIAGLGTFGYKAALDFVATKLQAAKKA